MIEIFLEGLEFYGYHGVPAAEREVGHRYSIDIWMTVDSQAELTDDVNDTADYAKIGAELVRMGENQQYKTLERMAHEMASAVLALMPKVEGVRIEVRKMMPPAPFVAESSGVTLELSR